MSDEETLRMIRSEYGAMIDGSAAYHKHRPEVIAGIVMQETAGGTSNLLDTPGPGGRGDRDRNGHYHGHGLGQIDDRSFPEFCADPSLWADANNNIRMIGSVLSAKRRYISAKLPDLDPAELECYSICAYNCGEGTTVKAIMAGIDPETRTATKDYSGKVLGYAEIYKSLSEVTA